MRSRTKAVCCISLVICKLRLVDDACCVARRGERSNAFYALLGFLGPGGEDLAGSVSPRLLLLVKQLGFPFNQV